jgi:type I restriction enzyme S subunit
MPKVSQPKIAALEVPLPPRSVQLAVVAEVARRLSLISAASSVIDHSFAKVDRVRQAILRDAFSGRWVETGIGGQRVPALVNSARGSVPTVVRPSANDHRYLSEGL